MVKVSPESSSLELFREVERLGGRFEIHSEGMCDFLLAKFPKDADVPPLLVDLLADRMGDIEQILLELN